jgi:hypothetical protein
MATSFITFKNKHGFWIRDYMMEAVIYYVYKAMLGNDYKEFTWLVEIADHFEVVYKGTMSSFINLHLDETLDNDDKIRVFIDVLNETKKQLLRRAEISADELNNFEKLKIKGQSIKWVAPVKTIRFTNIIDHLIRLVNGELTTTASSDEDYEF